MRLDVLPHFKMHFLCCDNILSAIKLSVSLSYEDQDCLVYAEINF